MPQRERLKALSDRIEQIASLVEEITTQERSSRGEKVDFIRKFRMTRAKYFPSDYFADPAWDILIDLAKAAESGEGLPATHIGLDMGVPLSTVLRYLKRMEADGFVRKEVDQNDTRRSLIFLTEKGIDAVRNVFDVLPGQLSR